MKNILEFINEAISREAMKNFIINTLDNDDFYQKLTDKSLSKAYDIIAKETGGTLSMVEPTRESVESYIVSRNISKTLTTNIIRSFKIYDAIDVLNCLITNQLQLPTSEYVFQSDFGDLLDFFVNYTFKSKINNQEYKLPKELLGELANTKTQGIGQFEVLCDLFIDDIIKGNAGDIVTKNSGVCELKCNGGRVMSKSIRSAEVICNKYDELFKQLIGTDSKNKGKDPSGYFHSTESISAQINELNEYYKNGTITNIEDIAELLCHSFLHQYGDDKFIMKYLPDAKRFLLDKKIITKSGNNIKIDISLFRRFVGCEQLYFYQNIDNWNYMIVLATKIKNDIALNGKYKKIPDSLFSKNFYSSLNNIWNIKEIKFTGWPYQNNSTTSAQDNAVHIELVK